MGKIEMRNRDFLVIFARMILTLHFTSQVLAQAPIEGWGKARFGMTLEESKAVYGEDEAYSNETDDREFGWHAFCGPLCTPNRHSLTRVRKLHAMDGGTAKILDGGAIKK